MLFIPDALAGNVSFVRQKLENFLENKWGTDVSIGKVNYRLPNWIMLENVAVLDRKRDTVLYCGRLYVAVKMLKLLSDVVDVASLRLEDAQLHCRREQHDSTFNFQFILDAFAPGKNQAATTSDDRALQLSLGQVALERIRLNFTDAYAGIYLSAFIGELSLRPQSINLEKRQFRS